MSESPVRIPLYSYGTEHKHIYVLLSHHVILCIWPITPNIPDSVGACHWYNRYTKSFLVSLPPRHLKIMKEGNCYTVAREWKGGGLYWKVKFTAGCSEWVRMMMMMMMMMIIIIIIISRRRRRRRRGRRIRRSSCTFFYRHAPRSTGFLVYVIATWKISKKFNTHVTATLVLNSALF